MEVTPQFSDVIDTFKTNSCGKFLLGGRYYLGLIFPFASHARRSAPTLHDSSFGVRSIARQMHGLGTYLVSLTPGGAMGQVGLTVAPPSA